MPSSCVCVSVCVSVTLRYCIKTAKRRITQIMPHDSPMTLVFWCQRSWRNSNGITPYGGDKCRWGELKLVTFNEKRAITRKRYKIDVQFLLKSNRKSYGDVSHNLGCPLMPQTTPIFFNFSSPFISLYWVNVEISNSVRRLVVASPSIWNSNGPWNGRCYVTWPIFTVWRYAKRGICRHRVSVCLSVCLSHSGIVSKRLNIGSRKYCRTIAPGL